jgi:uncharacterized protein YggE
MKKILFSSAFLLLIGVSFAQIGGGGATYQRGQSRSDAALAAERAKRSMFKNEDGRYFEASVLLNIEADQFVAVFGINEEGKTLDEARSKMDATVAAFRTALKPLNIRDSDTYLDFVSQNRIYGFVSISDSLVKESVVGFEVKKTFAIKLKDKNLIEKVTEAASTAGVFDLVKVDYVVSDLEAVHKKLYAEAVKLIKDKRAEQADAFGLKGEAFLQTYPAQYSTYYPVDLYNSYTAEESEDLYGYRQNQNVQRARKPKTFYFDGLTGQDFDVVINPALLEPTVQCTIYLRVKY